MAAPETVTSRSTPPAAAPDALTGARRGPGVPAATAGALIALTVAGAVLRAIVAGQSVFADELSTYWISATHGLGGVLSLMYSSGRIQHAEITPPVSFLASWLSTRLGDSPELLRLPALLAGTATIPLVYALGRRAVSGPAGLLAAAVTAFSPFMIYYSAEARAYGIMMLLVGVAVLAMLIALDTGRDRWWVVCAVAMAGAFLTHYTSAFVLAVAMVWALVLHPAARRRTLLAIAGAGLLVVPWIPGLIADLQSPTVSILSALSPFTGTAVRVDIQHWAIGYPYTVAGGINDLPGVPALVLLAIVVLATAGGLVARGRREHRLPAPGDAPRRFVLLALLAVATPTGEILGSATGNHIIGVRDLAASWPFLALAGAALVTAAARRVAVPAAGLTVVAFVLGGAKMLEARYQRPDYQSAGAYVAAHARAGDVVIDETGGLSPGPLTGFDVAFHRRLPVLRARSPAERDHPYTVFDPIVSLQSAVERAVAAAHGHRVFLVAPELLTGGPHPNPAPTEFPAAYALRTLMRYPGIEPTLVAVYAPGR